MRSVSLTRQLAMLRRVVVPVGVQRHGGQGHGRVRDVVAVQVNGLEGPCAPLHLQPVGAAGDFGAHGLGGFHEADVALDRVQPHALDLDAFWPSALEAIAPSAMK